MRFGATLFGIPFQPLSLQEAEQGYRQWFLQAPNLQSLHLTFADEGSITPLYGGITGWLGEWSGKNVHDREQLAALRHYESIYTFSPLLNKIASLLGFPLNDGITEKQLWEQLCYFLADEKKTVFLIGDNKNSLRNAALALQEQAPGVQLVGTAVLPHTMQDSELSDAFSSDSLLLEQIHAVNAEVLLILLQGRSAKVWLERIRRKLKVPYVLNLGSSFHGFLMLKGDAQEARSGLSSKLSSWLSSFQVFIWSLPMLSYHGLNALSYRWQYRHKSHSQLPKGNKLFIASHNAIAAITLPPLLGTQSSQAVWQRFMEANQQETLIVDFRELSHIDLEGLSLLIAIAQQCHLQHKPILCFKPTTDILTLLKFHRVYDLYQESFCHSGEELCTRLSTKEIFYDCITQHGSEQVTLSLLGHLSNSLDYPGYLDRLRPMIANKNLTIDLSFCTSLDSLALAFLLQLRHLQASQNCKMTLSHLSRSIYRQLKMAKISSLFAID